MHAMHILSPVFGFCFPPLMDFIEQTVLILTKPSLPSLYVPSLWRQLQVLGTDLDSQAFQFCKSCGLERWLTTACTSNSRGFSALFSLLFRHQHTHGIQSCIYILYALPPSPLPALSPSTLLSLCVCPIAPYGLLKGDFYFVKLLLQFIFAFLYYLEDSVTMQDDS